MPPSDREAVVYAHLYKARGGRGWELFICRSSKGFDVLHYDEIIKVSNKRQARIIATAIRAICWNF
jgi:hypothetical protein